MCQIKSLVFWAMSPQKHIPKHLISIGSQSVEQDWATRESTVRNKQSWYPRLIGKRKRKWESISHSVVSDSWQPHGLQSARLLCPWDFPGKDTGVGCHFLLHGIFPTQSSNPSLKYPALAGRWFTTEPPESPCSASCNISFITFTSQKWTYFPLAPHGDGAWAALDEFCKKTKMLTVSTICLSLNSPQ